MKYFKEVKTYLPFTTNAFQAQLTYKANTMIFFCGEGVIILVSYYLWKAIYGSSTKSIISGFNFNEMIIYMLLAFLIGILTDIDVSTMIYREVKDGSIAINLVRPINYCKRMFFQALGNIVFNFVLVFSLGFILVTVLFISIEHNFNILNIILSLITTVLSIILSFYYRYCFGLLSFKITNMWGLAQIMGAIFRLLSGALIPLSFFPMIMQKIFGLLPFSSIISTPTLIYLGKIEGMELIFSIGLQVVWIGILILLSRWMWNKLITELTILGG
ncbi:putative transmembrane protein [Clostridium bornimense]|uniref:Putative transmembrane protein n=1 Tax=Clostridium bornimense TaxID=1216932 RepID=W6RWF3_9CLOT|nr:ABC-2 family transporter protein [Clostridium bornimense]CDM69011.1 putative transmembrane protein [Clostridium bornimense]